MSYRRYVLMNTQRAFISTEISMQHSDHHHLMDLNDGQLAAVRYGVGDGRSPLPLLIIAGAGTGKTKTLAHRVAHLILNGADPQRILLLTFTRRAAAEMTRRAASILGVEAVAAV